MNPLCRFPCFPPCCIGPRGLTGPQGPRGPQGPIGPEGPEGPAGASFLAGVGPPTCDVGKIGDTYLDMDSGELYQRFAIPTSPAVRPIPPPTGVTIPVGSTRLYTDIQSAIDAAAPGDRLLLDPETFVITTTINVNKSLTIEGTSNTTSVVVTTDNAVISMFSITVSDVVIKSLGIVQNFPAVLDVESVISASNILLTGIYIDGCEIYPCELGINVGVAEFQITNCDFFYAPLAEVSSGYYCIYIPYTNGESIIDNNRFVSDSGDTDCRFIIITNILTPIGGSLTISNNEQQVSPYTLRHMFIMETFLGVDFSLFIFNNTTIYEGNAPILFANADNSIFYVIELYNNNIQNTIGKGLMGYYLGSTGTPYMFEMGNILATEFFKVDWDSASVPFSYVLGYDTTNTTDPEIPLLECFWYDTGYNLRPV